MRPCLRSTEPLRAGCAGGVALVLILLVNPAWGEEWAILGARAMGMGGAGVAATRGGASLYWNPAALARTGGRWSGGPEEGSPFSLNLTFGLSSSLAVIGDTIEELADLREDVEALDLAAVEQKLSAGTPLSEEELRLLVRIVAEDVPALSDDGFLYNAIGGPSLQIGRFGVGLFGTIHSGVTAVVDMQNIAFGELGLDDAIGPGQDRSAQLSAAGQRLADQIASSSSVTQNQAEELVFQAEQAGVDTADSQVQDLLLRVAQATGTGGTGPITENRTGPRLNGIFLQELALGYGLPLGDRLALGVSLKAMHAYTYSQSYLLRDLPDMAELVKDVVDLEERTSSYNWGVDAGALFTPLDWVAVGVTGRNLNRPSFDHEGGGHFVLEPQVRAGVAVQPLRWLTLAADIDLIENSSEALPGHRSRVVGVGAQFDLGTLDLGTFDIGAVALRAGCSRNLADLEEEVLLHAGLALRIWRFSLEAAAMVTPELKGIGGGDEIPERAGASLTAGFNIGF